MLFRILLVVVPFLSFNTVFADIVKIDNKNFYASSFGKPENQAVIFLHGGPGYNSLDFEVTAAQAVADKGYFVVVYDRRGNARSESENDITKYNMWTAADDLKGIMSHYSISNPILIGHSFGGAIAVNYEKRFGDSKGIVLVGAPMVFYQTLANLQEVCAIYFRENSNTDGYNTVRFLLEDMFIRGRFTARNVSMTFQQAIACGAYEVQNPTQKAKELNEKLGKHLDVHLTADSNYNAIMGYIANENYSTMDLVPDIETMSDKVFAIYGEEDSLFSELHKIRVETALGIEGKTYSIPKSAHNPYRQRQDLFLQYFVEIANKF